MATSSTSASTSSRLWSGELELDGKVLSGLALFKRAPLSPSASSSAKGKQKANTVAAIIATPSRSTRSRASATGLPSPASTASASGRISITSSPEHELLIVSGVGSELSPPVCRPGERDSAGKLVPFTSSSNSREALPAAEASETLSAPAIRRIKLISTLFPHPSELNSSIATLTAELAAEGSRLVVHAVAPMRDLESCGVELPSIELDFRQGLELRNIGPNAEWPYDRTPTGRLHEQLDTAASDGRTKSFALVIIRSSQDASPNWTIALAVYGWGGSLETREMRLFATVLDKQACERLPLRYVPERLSSLTVGQQEGGSSGSIFGDPDEDLERPQSRVAPALSVTLEPKYTPEIDPDGRECTAVKNNSHAPVTVAARSRPMATREPRSESSIALEPPHPPSSSDDASSAVDDPAPLPPRSKRPRPNDRNRPLKDRLANTGIDDAIIGGGSAYSSGPPGARPGVWSKPSTSRRPAKRARKLEAALEPRSKTRVPLPDPTHGDGGTWETRRRIPKDVHDGGVDSWRAGVVAGAGLIEQPPSPPGGDAPVPDVAALNLNLLRRCTTMSLFQHDMSRNHPDWRLVHGFIVRGAKFSLRHCQATKVLRLCDVLSSVVLHVDAYLPSGLLKNPSLREEAARLRKTLDGSKPEQVESPVETSMDITVPMNVDIPIAVADIARPGANVIEAALPPLSATEAPISPPLPGETTLGEGPVVPAEVVADNAVKNEQCPLAAPAARATSPAPIPPSVTTAAVDNSPLLAVVPAVEGDVVRTPAQSVAVVGRAPMALPNIAALRDVFYDGDSDLTSVASEDEDEHSAGEEEEEEEFINSRPATPAPPTLAQTVPSSPLSVAPMTAPLTLAPPPAAIAAAAIKTITPFRRATRSSALLNLALYSSASKAENEAAALTSPSQASSISVATPPDGQLVRTLLLHGKTDDAPTPRRSTRRVSSGLKLAASTTSNMALRVPPVAASALPSPVTTLAPAKTIAPEVAQPPASGPPALVPELSVLPLAKDFVTRHSPRRTSAAASRSLPPSPPPSVEDEEAADLGAAFERTIGRGGEVVYLLSRRLREGTAVSACTI